MRRKVLFDIIHPACVYLFRNAIDHLICRGDEVVVVSRDKDITLDLLDELNIENIPISTKRYGRGGLLRELFQRNVEMLKIARRFAPDLFISNNACASHVAWILNRPSLLVDDTEIDRYNRWLYYPFASEVHTPDSFRFRIGKKQITYPGYHTLAYLHPNHFRPDPDILKKYGINPDEKMVFFRFVEWEALHDMGLKRLNADEKFNIVMRMSEHVKVFISAEGTLPSELEAYRVSMPFKHIHHLLYYVDLVIGESGSMSSEAAVLGTPSIYVDEKGRGYTDEQDKTYGLCYNFKPDQTADILKKALELISLDNTREHFKEMHSRILENKIDVSNYQIRQIDRLLQAG